MKRNLFALVLYLALSLFFLQGVLFSPGIIIGCDWALPLTKLQIKVFGERAFYTWGNNPDVLGMRFPHLSLYTFDLFVSLLPKIGIDGAIFNKILLVLLFFLIGFSSYYFCRKIRLSFRSSLLAGFIYMTTPLVFNYSIMGWVFMLLVMAIVPFFILAFKFSVEKEKIGYSIIAGLLFAVAMFQGQAAFWFPLLMIISFPFLVFSKRRLFLFIRSFLIVFLIALAVHANWIFPLVFFPSSPVSKTVSLYDYRRFEIRLSFINILRLWGGLFNYQFETVYPRFLLPISFVLPVLSFSSLILRKRDKEILHLATIALLPLTIYGLRDVLYRLPFSNVIRDFSRMTILAAFPYSVLAVVAFEKLGRIKKSLLAKLLLAMIVLALFLNSLPFWVGELYGEPKTDYDQRLRTLEFPLEHKEAEIFLSKNLKDTKTLWLPSGTFLGFLDNKKFSGSYRAAADIFALFSQRPGTFTFSRKNIGPSVGYGELVLRTIEDSKLEDLEGFLKLTSINTLLIRKNAYGTGGEGPKIEKTVEKLPDIVKIFDRPKISIYRYSNFLPHFYVPQNIIYSGGDINSLTDIVGLKSDEARPGVYLPDITDNAEVQKTLMERADEVFVRGELENKVKVDKVTCLRGCIAGRGIFYPHVKHEPGSFMHELALLKEEWSEWKARKDPERLFEKKLFYASKRVSEIEKLDMVNEQLAKTLERYKQKIEEAIRLIENEERGKKIWEYLEGHEEKLRDLEIKKLGDWEKVFEKLNQKLARVYQRPEFDLRNLEYSLEIPREETYEVYVKRTEIEKLENWEIDGEKMMKEEMRLGEDGWIDLGKRSFEEGEHKLVLHLPEAENLVSKNWQQFSDLRIGNEVFSLSSQSIFSGSTSVLFQEIRDYTPNTIFSLSFDYNAQNGKAGFSIIQDTDKDEESGEINSLITRTLRRTRSEKFEQAEIFFKSSPRASSAKLYLFVQPEEDKIADVSFKNVKIEKALEATVLLQAKTDEVKAAPITPKITFVKVNPTKYKMKIEGAKEPYTLIFSESFHEGWRAYVSDQRPVTSDQYYGEIVASYFDGEIKEGEHKNIFLNRNTFETWGKKPISEDRHYLINGYANSWFITPEDTGGRENYEIIIEFWPQRPLYIGLGISLITLLGSLGYLGYNFVEKKRR